MWLSHNRGSRRSVDHRLRYALNMSECNADHIAVFKWNNAEHIVEDERCIARLAALMNENHAVVGWLLHELAKGDPTSLM